MSIINCCFSLNTNVENIIFKSGQKIGSTEKKSERLIFIICCKATKLMTRAIGLEQSKQEKKTFMIDYDLA